MSRMQYETLRAVLTADGVIHGKICMTETAEMVDVYDGPYDITPKTTAQLLNTENTYLTKDINVASIPFYSVDNTHNGQTIIIGDELNYGSK